MTRDRKRPGGPAASEDTAPRRVFSGRDLQRVDAALRYLARGGVAIAEGPWPDIERLYRWLENRARELVRGGPPGQASGRSWDRARTLALERLVARPPADVAPLFPDPTRFVPVREILLRREALAQTHPVAALGGAALVAGHDILAPKSQENLGLIRRAVESCREELPAAPEVLDMGTGSGVCALIAADVLGPSARVTATDVMPQALAAARLNASRLGAQNVRVTRGGNLFAPVQGRRFDLVIFNAPWVVAPVRSPIEVATNDPGQATVGRFLAEVGDHLAIPERTAGTDEGTAGTGGWRAEAAAGGRTGGTGGRVVLGYADHSGPKAIDNLEAMIRDTGLLVVRQFRDRIRTHRRRRAWETVLVYVLARPTPPPR